MNANLHMKAPMIEESLKGVGSLLKQEAVDTLFATFAHASARPDLPFVKLGHLSKVGCILKNCPGHKNTTAKAKHQKFSEPVLKVLVLKC